MREGIVCPSLKVDAAVMKVIRQARSLLTYLVNESYIWHYLGFSESLWFSQKLKAETNNELRASFAKPENNPKPRIYYWKVISSTTLDRKLPAYHHQSAQTLFSPISSSRSAQPRSLVSATSVPRSSIRPLLGEAPAAYRGRLQAFKICVEYYVRRYVQNTYIFFI